MIRLGSLFETGDAPREAFNWRLGISILAFGILGAARGLDEGAVSGKHAQRSVLTPHRHGIVTHVQSTIPQL